MMENRSPWAVLGLGIITLGIYFIVWQVKTKGELNQRGATIPTAWLIIVPFVNIWWDWKYAEGAEQVSNKQVDKVVTFLLMFLLGGIGFTIIQHQFNNLSLSQAQATQPSTPQPESPTNQTPAA